MTEQYKSSLLNTTKKNGMKIYETEEGNEDDELEDEMEDEEEEDEKITARPRRYSEMSAKKNDTKPIPKGSAFFIFSSTNK